MQQILDMYLTSGSLGPEIATQGHVRTQNPLVPRASVFSFGVDTVDYVKDEHVYTKLRGRNGWKWVLGKIIEKIGDMM